MAKINDIIHDMESMLSQSDLSSTPVGKQLADSYAGVCRELNNDLQECRNMFRMGAYSEARKINFRSNPPLTERWKVLNFPKRQQWIELCRLYNWTVPPEFDQETLEKLLKKDSADLEFTIEDLQNQWRKIIRNGSLQEKIVLARKIYALSHDKASYANLVNVERPWIKKLKNDADAAMAENRPEDLFNICAELSSNQWQTKVSAEELKKYQPMLNEFKRKKLEEEKKTALELIASAYSAMLLPELEQSLAVWAELEKNPFFTVTREESLQISDARNFFLEEQAKVNEEEKFESLQSQLEMLLDDQEHSDPVEVERIFHQLQMFDRPIRIVLEERMNSYLERRELEIKRIHVRKCFYWGFSAVAVSLLIFAGIFFGHRELEMRRDSSKIREMLDQNHIEAALGYCEKIAKERPSAAKRTVIAALHQEAKKMLVSARAAEVVFNRTCKDIEKYFTPAQIFDPNVDKLFATLDEKAKLLPQEKIVAREALRRKYEEVKNQVFAKNEIEFLGKVRAMVGKWRIFLDNVETFAENDASKRAGELQIESDNILNAFHGKIRNAVHNEQKKNFSDYGEQAKESIANLRKLQNDTRGLYYPDSLDSYCNALENIGSISSKISSQFAEAAKQFPREKNLAGMNLDHARFFTAATASNIVNPFLRDIRAVGNPPFFSGAAAEEFKNKVNAVKQNILEKTYKVYELTAVDSEKNRVYHLYVDDLAADIQLETSWDKERTKAMSISFLVNPNGAKENTVFRIFAKKQKNGETDIILARPDNQRFETLPAKLKLVRRDALEQGGNWKVSAHYTLMKTLLDSLSYCNRYTQVMDAVVAAVEDTTVTNTFAKAHMIRELLKFFPDGDTFYKRELAGLKRIVDEYLDSPVKERWLDPTATFNMQDAAAFQKNLDELEIRKIAGVVMLNESLIEFAIQHQPQVYGVIFADGDKWRLFNFANAPRDPKELFIHHTYGTNKENLYCSAVTAEYLHFADKNGKSADDVSKYFYNGQLVFTVYAQETFAGHFEKVKKDIRLKNWVLPDLPERVEWPESWPLNIRSLE